ncbi:MAG: hypothetical protein GXY05_03955 [Clostridiales bacterium]|nr:hypothetical protein [Clostridiales bacterium]
MRKFLAIALAFTMAFALFGCGKQVAAPATVTPAAPSASAPTEATAPADSAAPAESQDAGTIGYLTDKVNHFSRDPYKLVSMALNTSTTYTQKINENLANWGTVLNYELVIYNANEDYDAYLNELEVQTMAGADGFFCGMSGPLISRTREICLELDVDFIGCPTAFADDKTGEITWPSVNQSEYGNGKLMMQWLTDNYKNYWKDPVDEAKLGLIIIDFSPVIGIHNRLPGVQDVFEKEFPGAKNNIFIADCVAHPDGFSTTAAYDLTAQYMTANASIEKWFVATLVDDWAIGATRSIEAMEKEDSALVVSIQSDAFINEVTTETKPSVYIAASAISVAELTGLMATGLVAMLDGRATAETLWPEWVRDGEKYPCIDLDGKMITRETYKQWESENNFEALSAGMAKG